MLVAETGDADDIRLVRNHFPIENALSTIVVFLCYFFSDFLLAPEF